MTRAPLADLNAFMAVARERSFTRAAAHLGVSASALSQTIRGLEERLGMRLLTRTTRSVALTEAGERLIATVGPHLEGIETGLAALSELRDKPAGTIRITAVDHAAETILWRPFQIPIRLSRCPCRAHRRQHLEGHCQRTFRCWHPHGPASCTRHDCGPDRSRHPDGRRRNGRIFRQPRQTEGAAGSRRPHLHQHAYANLGRRVPGNPRRSLVKSLCGWRTADGQRHCGHQAGCAERDGGRLHARGYGTAAH